MAVLRIMWQWFGGSPLASSKPKGFRDVHWCPYINEPCFLIRRGEEWACPYCASYEPETHEFVLHVHKPPPRRR